MARGRFAGRSIRVLERWRRAGDSQRIFEAIWLAPHSRARGVRHVHAHFGGVAACTAWWLRRLFGFSYSFTGHARVASGTVPLIISVGRYVEKKGFCDLIAACGLLRERGVEFECRIVGGGSLEGELRVQIDAAELGETGKTDC